MDIIIEDVVLYRDKKKWIKRLCKLARTNNFSDSVKLLVCAHEDGKTRRSIGRQCAPLLSKHVIYGHLHGVHMGSQSYVMYIVCKSTVECLAFEDFDTMKLWSDHLGKHLQDISQFVDLVYADKHSQLKNKLEGRLFFNCSHVSFIRSPSSYEPKLLMSWKIADVMEYGCRNVEKNGSAKGKQKTNFIDDSQKLFIMKVSPLYHRAPNTHIFSCKDPRQFCTWMENLASNQENVLFSKSREMSQRLRIDSYSTFSRSRNNSGSSPEYDSPGIKTTRFFGDQTYSRNPRYQRSSSEMRQWRPRLDSEEDIEEKEELDINDQKVSLMCQSETMQNSPDPESPTRSATVTWLERYPFQNERGRKDPIFRRQMSEGNQNATYANSTQSRPIEFTLPRPKSSNNYCSLLNLRQKSDSPLDCSPPKLTPISSISETLSAKRDKDKGQSHDYVNLGDNVADCQLRAVAPTSYVNIEFNHLVQEIKEFCKTENGAACTTRT